MSRLRSRTIAEYGLEDHSFEDDRAPIRLCLYRLPNPDRPPVLLLHGASARMETFAVPEPLAGRSRSLLSQLHQAGFEPDFLESAQDEPLIDFSLSFRHAQGSP